MAFRGSRHASITTRLLQSDDIIAERPKRSLLGTYYWCDIDTLVPTRLRIMLVVAVLDVWAKCLSREKSTDHVFRNLHTAIMYFEVYTRSIDYRRSIYVVSSI